MQRQSLGLYQGSNLHPPLKLSVFSKLHQLQGIVEQLQLVSNLAPAEKHTWLTEHEQTTLEMFHEFEDYIRLDFDREDLDQEMLGLLTEYSRSLQECAAYMQSLFPEARLQG